MLVNTIERVQAEIVRNGEMYRQYLNERREAQKAFLIQQKGQKEREEMLKREIKRFVSKIR